MARTVSLLVLVFAFAPFADAKTPVRVCRKACAPLMASVCPAKGRPHRKCRRLIVRECHREGVAVCAFAMPTGSPGDGSPVTTTPGGDGTSTTTTTVSPPLVTTTTTPTGTPSDVAGTWDFEGTIVQRGCGFDASYDSIGSTLVVSQQGSALSGTAEGSPATGDVTASGWSFGTQPDCRVVPGTSETCCVTFSVDVDGFGSPASAQGTAVANCGQGSICTARWTGTVTSSN
jgi:hypothetical protein